MNGDKQSSVQSKESAAVKGHQPPREGRVRCPYCSESTARCPRALIKLSTAMAFPTSMLLEHDHRVIES